MTELGEAVFVAIIGGDDSPCPFCESKGEQKKPPLEIINDSRELGKNVPGPQNKRIKNPDPSGQPVDVEIKERYWISTASSKLGQNAHHVIPGNASLAKASSLHQWLAWEVDIKKRWYSKTEPEKVGVIRSSVEETDAGVMVERTRTVEKRTKSGARMLDQASTKGHKVYGKVEYDINCMENGIWLPSNNAVYNWSALTESYQRKYAKRAMVVCGVQFHDAHPTYSDSVLDELKSIEAMSRKRAFACMEHEDSDTEPWPAPRKLKRVLEKLAREISRRKLVGKPGKSFDAEWSTSRFAAGFKMPKKRK